MKIVVIIFEDVWLFEDGDLGDFDLCYFEEQGVLLLELVCELYEDFFDQIVYVDGLDLDEILIDKIFGVVGQEVLFEIVFMFELIIIFDIDVFEDCCCQLMIDEGLEFQLLENGVYVFLLLVWEEGLFDQD